VASVNFLGERGRGNSLLLPLFFFGSLEPVGVNMSKFNYIKAADLGLILQQMGWDYSNHLQDYVREHTMYNGQIPFRADFYPEGVKLATSKKAVIIADGKCCIEYKGVPYLSPWMIFDCHGQTALDDIDNWIIKEERQWLIKKINGDWVRSFTLMTEIPFRTNIRC